MDLPTRRVRKIVEHVIDTGDDGIDAKTFEQSYIHVKQTMRDEGVDFSHDDCFRVTASEGEIVFSYEKR
ncbi:hypothetical protein PBI_DEWDROP_22 [Microbacterium phage Dewdrop]|nr:hypothetical protein PBI_LEAF_22 [Microbacterium phage Leaf]QGZ17391.1 hypothetical protein PBI_DEWDROP_22 [Microbacterium phage Dewdrop]